MKTTKVLTGHKFQIRNGATVTEGHDLIIPAEPITFRDKIGRSRGQHRWVRLVCNDPQCPAEFLWRHESAVAAFMKEWP